MWTRTVQVRTGSVLLSTTKGDGLWIRHTDLFTRLDWMVIRLVPASPSPMITTILPEQVLHCLFRFSLTEANNMHFLSSRLSSSRRQNRCWPATRVVWRALSQQTERLLKEAKGGLPLIKQVIAQTRSMVLEGKKVASEQKVLSLFGPHTWAIPRHKGGALVEFGRQVILDEAEGGIVTRYKILSHPNEHGQAIKVVQHHQEIFEHPPIWWQVAVESIRPRRRQRSPLLASS
jgi:hypothetical protein